jgi:hypothetical protein
MQEQAWLNKRVDIEEVEKNNFGFNERFGPVHHFKINPCSHSLVNVVYSLPHRSHGHFLWRAEEAAAIITS